MEPEYWVAPAEEFVQLQKTEPEGLLDILEHSKGSSQMLQKVIILVYSSKNFPVFDNHIFLKTHYCSFIISTSYQYIYEIDHPKNRD